MRRWKLPRYFPGWIVTGGGGSGGAATVQTDGVTIQGDGSAGNKIAIKQVETDATLSGAGTIASTLKLTPGSAWIPSTFTSAADGPAQNRLYVSGYFLPYPVTFAHIFAYIQTADNTNNSDIGLYNAAGTLVCNAGAQHMGSTGIQTFATLQGSQTILPGMYYFALATAGPATIKLDGTSLQLCLFNNTNYAASAGGALPASITAPTVAPTNFGLTFGIYT